MTRFFTLLLLCGTSALAQTGQIVVTVQNSSGAMVPGALIRVGARPFRNTLASFNAVKKAALDGKATFTGVPQGPYEVCAQLPGGILLDSCAWLNRGPEIFLHADATTNVPVVLQTGSRITVQVDDTARQFSKEVYPGQKLRLEISAANTHPVPMVVKTVGNSRHFSTVVPANADLRLHVRSAEFQLADAKGAALNMKNPAQFIPLRSAPAAQGALAEGAIAAPILTLQIVGVQ